MSRHPTPPEEIARRHAPAAARNRDPILAVLGRVLPETGTILEVASGTGEHVIHFASALPRLVWQPSDPDPDARTSIAAWIATSECTTVRPPLELDARDDAWGVGGVDAVVCINMIHIAPWEAAEGLFRGASAILGPGAPLVLYGPFAVGGRHTAPSNEAFDASLRARDSAWGVRDLDEVAAEAARLGFRPDETVGMPANNLIVVFRR